MAERHGVLHDAPGLGWHARERDRERDDTRQAPRAVAARRRGDRGARLRALEQDHPSRSQAAERARRRVRRDGRDRLGTREGARARCRSTLAAGASSPGRRRSDDGRIGVRDAVLHAAGAGTRRGARRARRRVRARCDALQPARGRSAVLGSAARDAAAVDRGAAQAATHADRPDRARRARGPDRDRRARDGPRAGESVRDRARDGRGATAVSGGPADHLARVSDP